MLGRADRQDIHHPRIAYPQLCKVQAALFSDNEWRESENHGFLWFTSRHCSASPPANQQRYPTIDRLDWKCIPVGDEIIFHFVRRTAPSLGLISLRNDSKPFLCNDRWLKEISWQDLRACCGGNSNERDFQIVPPIDDNVGWINASKANEKKKQQNTREMEIWVNASFVCTAWSPSALLAGVALRGSINEGWENIFGML